MNYIFGILNKWLSVMIKTFELTETNCKVEETVDIEDARFRYPLFINGAGYCKCNFLAKLFN